VPANRRQATLIRAAENQKSKSAGSHADSGRVVLDFPGSRSSVFQVLVTEKSPAQFIATGLGGGAASKDGEALTIEFDGDGARLCVTLPATLLQQMQLLLRELDVLAIDARNGVGRVWHVAAANRDGGPGRINETYAAASNWPGSPLHPSGNSGQQDSADGRGTQIAEPSP
jgi:hypothetical protein